MTTNTIETLSDSSYDASVGAADVANGSDANMNGINSKMVILFTADWHEACAVGGPMDQLYIALAAASFSTSADEAASSSAIQFRRCNAEDNPLLAEKFEVTAVPTFCYVHQGRVVERIVGGEDAALVTMAVQRLSALTTAPSTVATIGAAVEVSATPPETTTITNRLDRLIRTSPVMIFIKGTPLQPKCGFSRQVVELLQKEDISFASFDILTDESVRQGLKTHSDWPTYPQIYVHGQLIGGLDIVREQRDEGPSLSEQWSVPKVGTTTSDNSIRRTDTTTTTPTGDYGSLKDRLQALLHRSTVMLFMKGLPSAPQCGFSRQIVQLLEATGVSYNAFDILSDEEVRQGLKEYSDWPTYPQLYVGGDLIGGLDIVKEMSEDGTLADALVPNGMVES